MRLSDLLSEDLKIHRLSRCDVSKMFFKAIQSEYRDKILIAVLYIHQLSSGFICGLPEL